MTLTRLQTSKYLPQIAARFPEFDDEQLATFVAIGMAESGGVLTAFNGQDYHGDPRLSIPYQHDVKAEAANIWYRTGSMGPWRIAAFCVGGHYKDLDGSDFPRNKDNRALLYNLERNIYFARILWQEAGRTFNRWTTYKPINPKDTPRYLHFMDDARQDVAFWRKTMREGAQASARAKEISKSKTPPKAAPAPQTARPAPKKRRNLAALRQTGKVLAAEASGWLSSKKSQFRDEGMRVSKKFGWSGLINTKLHLFGIDLEKAHPWLEQYDWLMALAVSAGVFGLYWVIGWLSTKNYLIIKEQIITGHKTSWLTAAVQRALGSKAGAVASARASGDWSFYDRVYDGRPHDA